MLVVSLNTILKNWKEQRNRKRDLEIQVFFSAEMLKVVSKPVPLSIMAHLHCRRGLGYGLGF